MPAPRHVSKLFLDSRYALPDGTFVVPGGEALLLTEDTKVWLQDFTCINCFDTLSDVNRNLYIWEKPEDAWLVRIGQLPAGPTDLETLRGQLQSVLNSAAKHPGMGNYDVSLVSAGAGGGGSVFRSYRVTCDAGQFQFPEEDQIRSTWNLGTSSFTNSTNTLFRFEQAWSSDTTSSFIDLRRVHNIYLHAPSFGAYNAVCPRGERTCIAKICCNVGYGSLLHYQGSISDHDFVEAGTRALCTLRLEARDVHGHALDFHGTAWSATLVFERL